MKILFIETRDSQHPPQDCGAPCVVRQRHIICSLYEEVNHSYQREEQQNTNVCAYIYV
jgi:hypothetical protein